ncbi:MAG: 50S ribosomal protein L10 [Clostridia bacterium]
MANEKTIAKKQEQVNELANELKDAKVVLLVDYRGITVTDVTKLRADLRNVNAEYKVIKNNIIRRALEANGESGLEDVLEGPVAMVIGKEDYLEPSKVIYNFTKTHDFYKIKGGIIEGKVMSAEEVITLAKLPSRQELLAKLAGALLGNITKLAVALDQVKAQKENA